MHAMITICLALLVIVAGMFLLAKTRTELLGKFFKFVSYMVIILGFLCVVCCLIHCFCPMGHCGKGSCSHDGHCMVKEKEVVIRH